MFIKDKAILATFRGLGPCEACGKVGLREAAHVYSRGSGGPDVFFNLVSLGSAFACACHVKSHNGDGPSLERLVEIVAHREGCTPNDVDMLVDGIRWILPKDPTFHQLREWLNTLSPYACALAEQVPALSKILLLEAA